MKVIFTWQPKLNQCVAVEAVTTPTDRHQLLWAKSIFNSTKPLLFTFLALMLHAHWLLNYYITNYWSPTTNTHSKPQNSLPQTAVHSSSVCFGFLLLLVLEFSQVQTEFSQVQSDCVQIKICEMVQSSYQAPHQCGVDFSLDEV